MLLKESFYLPILNNNSRTAVFKAVCIQHLCSCPAPVAPLCPAPWRRLGLTVHKDSPDQGFVFLGAHKEVCGEGPHELLADTWTLALPCRASS